MESIYLIVKVNAKRFARLLRSNKHFLDPDIQNQRKRTERQQSTSVTCDTKLDHGFGSRDNPWRQQKPTNQSQSVGTIKKWNKRRSKNSTSKTGFITSGSVWVNKKYKLRDRKTAINLDTVTFSKLNSAGFCPAICTQVDILHQNQSVSKYERISLSAWQWCQFCSGYRRWMTFLKLMVPLSMSPPGHSSVTLTESG